MTRRPLRRLAPLALLLAAVACAGAEGVEVSGGLPAASSAPAPAAAPAPATPAPVRAVSLRQGQIWIEGMLEDPCWQVSEPVVEVEGRRISVFLGMTRQADFPGACPVRLPSGYMWPIELPAGTPPGVYTVVANGVTAELTLGRHAAQAEP